MDKGWDGTLQGREIHLWRNGQNVLGGAQEQSAPWALRRQLL